MRRKKSAGTVVRRLTGERGKKEKGVEPYSQEGKAAPPEGGKGDGALRVPELSMNKGVGTSSVAGSCLVARDVRVRRSTAWGIWLKNQIVYEGKARI